MKRLRARTLRQAAAIHHHRVPTPRRQGLTRRLIAAIRRPNVLTQRLVKTAATLRLRHRGRIPRRPIPPLAEVTLRLALAAVVAAATAAVVLDPAAGVVVAVVRTAAGVVAAAHVEAAAHTATKTQQSSGGSLRHTRGEPLCHLSPHRYKAPCENPPKLFQPPGVR